MKILLSKAALTAAKLRERILPSGRASRLVDLACRLDKKNGEAFYQKGRTLVRLEKWTEALNAFQETLQGRTSPPPSFYHEYGMTLLKVSSASMSIQAFQMSLLHMPHAHWSAFELGKLQIKMGRYVEAVRHLRHAAEHAAENPWSLIFLAHALLAPGPEQNFDEATRTYLKFAEMNPHEPAPYHPLRELFLRLDAPNYLYADRVQKLIDDNPSEFFPTWLMGWIKSHERQTDEAIRLFNQISGTRFIVDRPDLVEKIDRSQPPLSPSFMILGPTKSGTTSLFDWLSQHPQIAPPLQKETRFLTHFFDCGYDWYASHFPRLPADSGLITGDCTPSYLGTGQRAAELRKAFPHLKLVVLHRNPVKRAYSAFQLEYRSGKIKNLWSKVVRSELLSLDRKLPTKADDFSQQGQYLRHSCILPQLEQWLDHFPAEQVLVLKSEEMFAQPQAAVNRLSKFFGLPSFELKEAKNLNPGDYRPMNEKLFNHLTDWFQPHEDALDAFLAEHELTKLPQERNWRPKAPNVYGSPFAGLDNHLT